jgi:hypothetical protein
VGVIETMTFGLAIGVDEDAFLAADETVQSDFAYQQRGLVRRTTARGVGESADAWIVIELWRSAEEADAAAAARATDPAFQALMGLVDAGSVQVRRYADLD